MHVHNNTVMKFIRVFFSMIAAGYIIESLTYPGLFFRHFRLDIQVVSSVFLLFLIIWRLVYRPKIQKAGVFNKIILTGAVIAHMTGVAATIADKIYYINFVLSVYRFHYEPVFWLGVTALSFFVLTLPDDQLRGKGTVILFYAPFYVMSVFIVLNQWPFNFLTELTKEDHLIENAQFVVLCIAALYSAIMAYGKKGFDRWLFVGACVVLLFLAGEEVAWGQRLLNYKAPHYFLQHNAQQETTLHNMLPFGYKPIELAYMVIGFFGAFVPYLMLIIPDKYKTTVIRKYGPRWYLAFYFYPIALYNVITLVFAGHTVGNFAEPCELLLYAGFLLYLIAINVDHTNA